MTLLELHMKICDLAPICSINSMGRIDFKPEATEEERQAAQAYMDAHLAELDETPVHYISKLAIVDRLITAGLLEQALAALSSDTTAKARWDAAVEINKADADVRALLTAIGADPNEILA